MNFLLAFGLFSGAKLLLGRLSHSFHSSAEVALEKETDRLIFEALIEIASHYSQPTPPTVTPQK